MIWNNLKLIPPRCPTCGEELELDGQKEMYICSNFECDFSIRLGKFLDIVNDLIEEPVFSGNCEICGRKINPRYRTCKDCF